MASRTRTILTLVAAAVAVGLLGAGVLLVTGSQIGVWIVAVGVPLVIVAGVAVYVQGVVNRDSTDTTEFRTDRARNTAVGFREAVTTYTQARETYPRWETESLDAQLGGLADDFEAAGVSVDATDGTFSVENPGNPRDFDELERSVSAFAEDRDESFREFVREEIRTANASFDRLTPDTLSDEETTVAVPDDVQETADIETAQRVLQRARDDAQETVETAIDRVEETITEYDRDPATIRDQLDAPAASAAEADFAEAVSQIERATSVVEEAVGGEFADTRESIQALIETVQESRVDEFVDATYLESVESIQSETAAVGSAMATDRLGELDRRLRATCREIVEQLETDLERAIDEIQAADIPVGFYTVPPAAGTDYRGTLRDAADLTAFRREWLQAVGELTTALSEAQEKATVAQNYGLIADRIESTLQSDGRVTGQDLPVQEPAQFMELYADTSSEVEYEPGVPALSAPGGGDTYDLTVTASLASHDGTEHEFTIAVTSDEYQAQTVSREYIAAQETFEALPYGEYDVQVSLADDAYPTIDRSVRVTADRTVELELSKLSLAERVCGSDRSAIESQLPTVSDELASQFETGDRYLTEEMNLPVAPEYAPCLLALWADQANHDARLDDGRVLVYDHDGVSARVEQAVRDRVVRDGEAMRLQTIRTNYLSVPVSDALVTEMIEQSSLDVRVSGGEVHPA